MNGASTARDLFARPTLEIAERLLGWRLVRVDADGTARVGRIVELEAYIGEHDRASHARFGRTDRNRVMYGPPGRAYVYLVYGMHDCLNIVTEPEGSPAALLVRAVDPLDGVAAMRDARERRLRTRSRRAGTAGPPAREPAPVHRLASGPGLVCAAFDLDRTLTGADLLDPGSPVHLEPPPPDEATPDVVRGPRVGVGYAGDRWATVPWRFAVAGDPSVSRPAVTR
ncbi:MAG TPA: DNA-3-methyladenine glycosylase [Candidatus Limnocylindrales bacterium]|nr:DNA-3-methyladenine glycosylase [Candidatus Limnocylindrales bacterium]